MPSLVRSQHAPSAWWWLLAALIPVLLWLSVFNRLRVDWSLNAQYSYGWVVPFIGGLMLWRRWQSRPLIAPANPNTMLLKLLLGVVLFAWVPLEIILEANPEWRMALWLAALLAAVFSLGALGLIGGSAWAKHAAFPILFLLIGVPWPTGLENAVVQGLMRGIAFCTVEVLDWIGIAAIQLGNVIEIPQGVVGVNEACSGVRSLQTTLLVSLTLGELLELTPVRRLALLLLGFGVALVANLGRTFLLVTIAARDGLAALHDWHDGAGIAVLVFVLVSLALLAKWLGRGNPAPSVKPTAPASPLALPVRPLGLALAILWLLAIPIMTEGWYRARETTLAPSPGWSLNWDVPGAKSEQKDIGETARAMLRCDVDRGLAWTDANGQQWQMFLLEWFPGRNSIHLARTHRPEICLTGIGMKLVRDVGIKSWSSGGLELAVRQYQFSQLGKPLHVFYALWEEGQPVSAAPAPADFGVRERLRAVREGKRHLGQRVLQVALAGPGTSEEAWESVRQELQRRVELRVAQR